nr:hypothetical protein [Rhizoctonia sp.]
MDFGLVVLSCKTTKKKNRSVSANLDYNPQLAVFTWVFIFCPLRARREKPVNLTYVKLTGVVNFFSKTKEINNLFCIKDAKKDPKKLCLRDPSGGFFRIKNQP